MWARLRRTLTKGGTCLDVELRVNLGAGGGIALAPKLVEIDAFDDHLRHQLLLALAPPRRGVVLVHDQSMVARAEIPSARPFIKCICVCRHDLQRSQYPICSSLEIHSSKSYDLSSDRRRHANGAERGVLRAAVLLVRRAPPVPVLHPGTRGGDKYALALAHGDEPRVV